MPCCWAAADALKQLTGDAIGAALLKAKFKKGIATNDYESGVEFESDTLTLTFAPFVDS